MFIGTSLVLVNLCVRPVVMISTSFQNTDSLVYVDHYIFQATGLSYVPGHLFLNVLCLVPGCSLDTQ